MATNMQTYSLLVVFLSVVSSDIPTDDSEVTAVEITLDGTQVPFELDQKVLGDEEVVQRIDSLTTAPVESPEVVVDPLLLQRAAEAAGLFEIGKSHLFGTNQSTGYRINVKHAVSFLQRGAALGSADAQFTLGVLYGNGVGVRRSEPHAILHFFFASRGGHIGATQVLAHRHNFANGVMRSCPIALELYQRVADSVAETYKAGGVVAHADRVRLADRSALKQKQTEEDIMHYYQYSADKGETRSQMVIGYAYMFGMRGLDQNADMAVRYFTMAVEGGEVAGHAGLGQLKAQGMVAGSTSVERNYTAALEHFKIGAEINHPVCLNGLGYLHMEGHGVPRNFTEAARLFKESADAQNPEAQYNLGVLHLNGEGVTKDPNKAILYLQKAAAQGQVLAHYQLGNVYAQGNAVSRNCPIAVKYFKTVAEKLDGDQLSIAYADYVSGDYGVALLHYLTEAERGNELSQANVAYMLHHNMGLPDLDLEDPSLILPAADDAKAADKNSADTLVQASRSLALHWFTRSAEQNHLEAADSYLKVGDYYYYGYSTSVDLEKAEENYRLAKDRRSPQATFNLGYMHEHGIFVKQDFHMSKRYYDMALEYSPSASVPVRLALLKLQAHQIWRGTPDPDVHNHGGYRHHYLRLYGHKVEDVCLVILVGVLALLVAAKRYAVRQPAQNR